MSRKTRCEQGVRLLAGMLVLGATVGTVGCDGGFFINTTTPTTTSTTGSYAYTANNANSSTSLGVYGLSSGSLLSLASSPFSLSFVPSALVVTPGNTFLYASSVANSGIYAYTISSVGVLGQTNSNAPVASINTAAMDVSPDGKYLLALDVNGSSLTEYTINTSTGALTFASTATYAAPVGTLVTPSSVRVAPSGAFVVASLGTAGDVVFPYSGGVIGPGYTLIGTGSASVGDYSAVLDTNNYLYVARTTGIAVYTLSTTGAAALVNGSPFPTGIGPRSVVLSKDYKYVYTANQGSGTISAFSIGSSGALTQLTNSPFSGVPSVTSLGVDNTGKYLIAAGYDATAGMRMYAIGSTGGLTSTSSVATGITTTVSAAVALTH
jgi:6-phosphogluconolactonase